MNTKPELCACVRQVNPITTCGTSALCLCSICDKEAIDHWRRAHVDAQSNSRPYVVYRRGGRLAGADECLHSCRRSRASAWMARASTVRFSVAAARRWGGRRQRRASGAAADEAVAFLSSTASLDGEHRPETSSAATRDAEPVARQDPVPSRRQISCEPPNADQP